MIRNLVLSLFVRRATVSKDVRRFAEIEYSRENPEYVIHMINSGQIFKN